MEDKAEKKKQREAELLDREARKKRLEKEEQERNLQDAKGQAHDMFSRIFRIRVTKFKFFYQILCNTYFNLFVTSKNESSNSQI